MKKIILAGISALFFAFTPASAMDFTEGVHYEVVGESRSSSPEIIDFFSLYCNACYQYRPFSDMLKNEFGDAFKKYHVNFVAPRGMSDHIIQIWATAQVLDVDDQFASRVFTRNFARNDWVDSVDKAKQVMNELGVSGEDFDRAHNSFAVRSLSNRMRTAAGTYNVRGTPTYIVNRKYRMLPEGFRDSGSDFFERYLELAKYLVQKD